MLGFEHFNFKKIKNIYFIQLLFPIAHNNDAHMIVLISFKSKFYDLIKLSSNLLLVLEMKGDNTVRYRTKGNKREI